jgi:hypothetical protein
VHELLGALFDLLFELNDLRSDPRTAILQGRNGKFIGFEF